ncbi:MAG TPA: S8 family serine peptidase [Pyrinomonadaceae bacterium]|jgi:serine protease AprX
MRFHRFSAARRLTSLVLLLPICLCTAGGARAQLVSGLTQTTTRTLSQTTQTLTQAIKVSPDLLQLITDAPATRRVPVVVQSGGLWGPALDLLLTTLGARTTRSYQNLNARALDIPAGNVLPLAASSLVSFVSADRPVRLLGHLLATTGADAVREVPGAPAPPDGTGVGVAVIDSGVYAGHRSFLDRSNRVRVVYSKDFTGEGRTDDPFGHGSHVAGVAAGNGRVSNGAYAGVAPNANVVNLRVLGSRGAGPASALLAALDWVLSNRATYNIRVVNLSLGTAAVDSYRDDPLCRAARKLANAGIVVVAAAGNEGKDG